jgi:hypothetical protein
VYPIGFSDERRGLATVQCAADLLVERGAGLSVPGVAWSGERGMCLWALELALEHPVTKAPLLLEIPEPLDFFSVVECHAASHAAQR